jgi:hypothetical protein
VTQPGWYPDPSTPGGSRWWDGSRWTEHVGGGATSAGAPPLHPEATVGDPYSPSLLPDAPSPTPPSGLDPYAPSAPPPASAPPQPRPPRAPRTSADVPTWAKSLGIAGVLLVLLLGGGIVVALLGGGDDGTAALPDLSNVPVGSSPDEDAFCDDVEALDDLADDDSPTTWAAGIREMAAHAYDEDSEHFADTTRGWFEWNVEGQRSQQLFDEVQQDASSSPLELCDAPLYLYDEQPSAEALRLESQAEQLADDQGLDQPGNRFFVTYGMVTVVFTDPTEQELLDACEAWGDEPFQSLADDGVVILGKSNDDIDVLEDPVVVRNGVDGSCRALEPTG